ncbi:hypothetical protein IWQ62_002697, partial [Dispira parvispora]
MTSDSLFPSSARTVNTYSAQLQGLTLRSADKQRENEINQDVTRRMIPDTPDLVKKVTDILSIGVYRCIAQDFEDLGYVKDPDPDSLHQRLYRKARGWFNPAGRSKGGRREAQMYPQFKAFVYLIALLLQDKRKKTKHPLKRYLLPHRMSDICGDPASAKRHDVAICWHDPDTEIEAECRAFLEYEETKSNQKQKKSSANQDPDANYVLPGASKKRSWKGKTPEVPEPDVDVTQSPFWRCFGIVECKADYNEANEQAEYGQLGWYAASALEFLFERNN